MSAQGKLSRFPSRQVIGVGSLLLVLAGGAWLMVRLLGDAASSSTIFREPPTALGRTDGRPPQPHDRHESFQEVVGRAVDLLTQAARSERAQGGAYELQESAEFDVRKYAADHQLTCYLATPDQVWLVVVTESDYPRVVDAWRQVAMLKESMGATTRDVPLEATVDVARTESADILFAPCPLGIPGVAYAFELQPGSDQPIYARSGDTEWGHTDAAGQTPVTKAWSYRTIEAGEADVLSWSLVIREGRAPNQPAIQITVRQ